MFFYRRRHRLHFCCFFSVEAPATIYRLFDRFQSKFLSPIFLRTAFFIHKCYLQYLQFMFVTFWQKEIEAKAACKMLVKLTTRGNFEYILRTAFFMCVLLSFYLLTICVFNFFGKRKLKQKLLVKC